MSTNYMQSEVGHQVEREYQNFVKGQAGIVQGIEEINGYMIQSAMNPVGPVVGECEK